MSEDQVTLLEEEQKVRQEMAEALKRAVSLGKFQITIGSIFSRDKFTGGWRVWMITLLLVDKVGLAEMERIATETPGYLTYEGIQTLISRYTTYPAILVKEMDRLHEQGGCGDVEGMIRAFCPGFANPSASSQAAA